MIRRGGMYRYTINKTNKMANEIMKSMKLVITELAGMINRGKYTLVTNRSFPTKLLLLSVSAFEKTAKARVRQKRSANKAPR